MAYTKTNIAKTLDNAIAYLDSGFMQGEWQCHIATRNIKIDDYTTYKSGDTIADEDLPKARRRNACSLHCCAEGAIELATGVTHGNKRTPYTEFLISKMNEKAQDDGFDGLIAMNDSSTKKTVLRAFREVKQEVLNG